MVAQSPRFHELERKRFYKSVVNRADDLAYTMAEPQAPLKRRKTTSSDSAQRTDTTGQDPAAIPDEATMAKKAYRDLAGALAAAIAVDEKYPVKVIVYFDEAHEFAIAPQPLESGADNTKRNRPERLFIDILCSSLGVFAAEEMMFLLLSTTFSFMDQYSSTGSTARLSRSIRGRSTVEHVPITELPFDCHPSFPIDGTKYSLDDTSKAEFLARFGRPLFWTLMAAGGLEKHNILRFAEHKLAPGVNYRPTATDETAAIDLLVMLDYAPSHAAAESLQEELIAGHMRTVASVSQDRRTIYSGYPSEPLLAEAAASLLESWYRGASSNRIVQRVSEHYSNGLLSLGDVGGLVARILLTIGYQSACRKEFSESGADESETYYSKGCKLKTFLQCTFVESSRILATEAGNVGPDGRPTSLESALGDAIVRFTHFSKWDQKGTSHLDAHSSFLRGAAIVCKTNQKSVDIIIPILVRTEGKACPHVITAILVQVKRRKQEESLNGLSIDEAEIDFFPKEPSPCGCCSGPLTSHHIEISRLPYLSLVLDLGYERPQPYFRLRPSTPVANPDLLKVSKAPTSLTTRSQSASRDARTHPRYAIYVGGCSPEQFKCVNGGNQSDYRRLLRLGGGVIGGHARRSSAHIKAVKELSLSRGYEETERWVKVPGNSEDEDQMEEVG
ncbi:hypothetical protein BC834DRAFT_541289 [Gloeopeniophorella convolvens]|nr:hypothetical protein BC834DRAFT_541289 [Gloeopeniophorella convolvens]